MAEPLEFTDMQQLILDGYKGRPSSRYALLEIKDPKGARAWLGNALGRVGRADNRASVDHDRNYRLNLAFSSAGLDELGLRDNTRGFLAPFREGMATEPRALVLGDTGQSHPKHWHWGRLDQPIHVLLMLFSVGGQSDADWASLAPELGWAATVATLDCEFAEFEHFGFRDGISQPYIEGSDTSKQLTPADAGAAAVKAGEFILGYLNEADVAPTSPTIPAALDFGAVLPARSTEPERRDFGRNGTYLVLRQLVQDVEGFERYLRSVAATAAEQELVAAKIVGRWRSGAPLVKAPQIDRKELGSDNDFAYYDSDRFGHACPIGAHVRRANPRDALVDQERGITAAVAARQTQRHRLLRRGRRYQFGNEKGLFFLCLNANIQDQFEFVQHNWLNSPRFAGLDGETDPLVGPRPDPSQSCPMTLQGATGSRRLQNLTRFVEVVGGGYFFLPGLRALECLARLR